MALDYYEYLKSPEWQEIRELALKRAGHKCQICGSNRNLDVHHNTYDSLGNEREYLEDLVVLCAEHHQLYHDALSEVEQLTDQRLEEVMIGALLQQTPAFFDTVLPYLSTEVFTSSLRRKIFSYLHSRASKGHAIDTAIVVSYLSKSRLLPDEEAEELLNRWVNLCPNPLHGEDYAQLLHNLYLRRRVQQLPAMITKLNRSRELTFAELIDAIQAEVQLIANKNSKNCMTDWSESLLNLLQDIEDRHQGVALPGLPCGFYDLDAMTGGFQRSDLIIVAGRPSMGKTSYCLNIAYNVAALHKLPVAIFSLEMSKEQLVQRMLASEAGIESNRLRAGRVSQTEWEPLSRAIGMLSEMPVFIDDTSNITVTEIRSQARRIQIEHGGRLGLIVLDYLQLMGGGSDNRVSELASITRALKGLAKEFNVPVIALSQLSRSVETRTNKRPMLSDLRESGSIEQEADLVLMIYRDDYYNDDSPDRGIAEVIIAKHRNGPTGMIKLLFDPQFTRFRNLASPKRR